MKRMCALILCVAMAAVCLLSIGSREASAQTSDYTVQIDSMVVADSWVYQPCDVVWGTYFWEDDATNSGIGVHLIIKQFLTAAYYRPSTSSPWTSISLPASGYEDHNDGNGFQWYSWNNLRTISDTTTNSDSSWSHASGGYAWGISPEGPVSLCDLGSPDDWLAYYFYHQPYSNMSPYDHPELWKFTYKYTYGIKWVPNDAYPSVTDYIQVTSSGSITRMADSSLP